MADGALNDLRVVECGEGLAGAFAGKAFADFGANVIKVEGPAGDPARSRGPFPGDVAHPEKSGQFLYLNANKRSVTLDLGCAEGRDALGRLAAAADVLLTDMPLAEMPAAGLDLGTFLDDKPRLTWTVISPFGLTGPYRDYKGSDLVAWHMGGTGAGTPFNAVSDPETQPPIRGGGNQAEYLTGWTAASATMAAIFYRGAYGSGQVVDVSRLEAVANMMRPAFAMHSYDAATLPVSRVKAGSPWIYPCKDGYVSTSHLREHWWTGMKALMGQPEWADSPAFETLAQRRENADALDLMLGEWFAQHTREELYEQLQASGVPCFPVYSVGELMEAPQYRARELIVEQAHPVARTVRQPGPSIRYSKTPWALRRPAPLLGEHTDEIFEEVGIAPSERAAASGRARALATAGGAQ